MNELFHTAIYIPIYNLLAFLVDIVPGADLGLAVIVTTLLVKFALMPLSIAAVHTQKAMKVIEPELKAIREEFKDNKERQARETFALYKKYNVKPFASILMLFIQLPIVLGLYFIFQSATLSVVDPELLYSFVMVPQSVSTLFLGIFPVAGPSLWLAIIAALTQAAQAFYAIPVPPKSDKPNPSMQEEFGRAIALQARYMLPIVIGVFAYSSGAIALYFTGSNIFMLAQEFIARTRKPIALASA